MAVQPTLELWTESPEETRALGRAVGRVLVAGDAVSLTGDLGAGKTTFVQGAAAGLEVQEPVLSPTFTLVREYSGTYSVAHVDVYRLDRYQDVLDLGLDELFERRGVVFVEWGDVIDALLPEAYLEVELRLPEGSGDLGRRVLIAGHGAPWEPRWPRIQEVAAPWMAPLADGGSELRPPGAEP